MLQQRAASAQPRAASVQLAAYQGRAIPQAAVGPVLLEGEAAALSRQSSMLGSERQSEVFDVTDADMDEAMEAITGDFAFVRP